MVDEALLVFQEHRGMKRSIPVYMQTIKTQDAMLDLKDELMLTEQGLTRAAKMEADYWQKAYIGG